MTATYFALQTIIVVAHEYAHSITAWLIGDIPSPLTVTWGNPVMIRGWDEGVPYDRPFPSGGNPSEAVIGGMPLLMHTISVIGGLYVSCTSQADRAQATALRTLLVRRDQFG